MTLIIFLFLLHSFTVLVTSSDCKALPPLQFPVKDVQVIPDIPNSYMRGIAAKTGTPAQDIILLPWPELNNTWIYDQDAYCDSSVIWDDTICQVRRGNYYMESQSTSFKKTTDLEAAGGSTFENQGKGAELGISKLLTSSLDGTDIFAFDSTRTVTNFPIGIPRLSWDHGYTTLHAMGMGRNSTLLNALVQTGHISSRVWSIFWGRMWVDAVNALDGSFVLGGYNQDQTLGASFTQPLDYSDTTGCWTGMKVHISNIFLNFANGSDFNILPTNTAIDVCIVPQRQLMLEAPFSLIETFERATGMQNHGQSFGLHWSAFLYDLKNIFDGDITFQLSNGLQIRVPNSQFLVPYVDIDRNGSRVFNTSERELLINGIYNQPATLGRYFLTAAYLMVDQDEGTFTLWQANPSSGSTLMPVMGSNAHMACQQGTIGDTSTNTTSGPGNSLSSIPAAEDLNQGSTDLSNGAIAGITVGGVLTVSLAGLIVLLTRRFRRRRSGQQKNVFHIGGESDKNLYNGQQQYDNAFTGNTYRHATLNQEQVYELHDDHSGVAEMHWQQEANVYEMGDNSHRR